MCTLHGLSGTLFFVLHALQACMSIYLLILQGHKVLNHLHAIHPSLEQTLRP